MTVPKDTNKNQKRKAYFSAWHKARRERLDPEIRRLKDKQRNAIKQQLIVEMRQNDPEAYKQYRQQQTQRRKKYRKKLQQERPSLYIWRALKHKCGGKGLICTVTPGDLVIPDKCPVLGLPLIFNLGGRRPAPNSVSIDRITPELGYTPGNVQVISQLANVMKNSATPAQLLSFARWALKTYGEHDE